MMSKYALEKIDNVTNGATMETSLIVVEIDNHMAMTHV